MTKSALQIARAAYQPKLPKALKGKVAIKEGAATQSVADQDAIKSLFPNTYGMPIISFESSDKGIEVIQSIDQYYNSELYDFCNRYNIDL